MEHLSFFILGIDPLPKVLNSSESGIEWLVPSLFNMFYIDSVVPCVVPV
jgi:hypothetical protein